MRLTLVASKPDRLRHLRFPSRGGQARPGRGAAHRPAGGTRAGPREVAAAAETGLCLARLGGADEARLTDTGTRPDRGLRCLGRPRAGQRDRGTAGPGRDLLQLRPPPDADRAGGGVLRRAWQGLAVGDARQEQVAHAPPAGRDGHRARRRDRDPPRRRAYRRTAWPTRWYSSQRRGWPARTSCSSADRDELMEQCALIFARRPGETLLAEQYLPGGLRTLETLGDGVTTWVLGGFRTRALAASVLHRGAAHLGRSGAGRGRASTSRGRSPRSARRSAPVTPSTSSITGRRPALIEVNDRLIGDHCDFVLSDLLGIDLFECPAGVPRGAAPARTAARARSRTGRTRSSTT